MFFWGSEIGGAHVWRFQRPHNKNKTLKQKKKQMQRQNVKKSTYTCAAQANCQIEKYKNNNKMFRSDISQGNEQLTIWSVTQENTI